MKKSIGIGIAMVTVGFAAVAQETGVEYPVSIGASAGLQVFEGDEAVEDAPLVSLYLAREWSEHWTLEGILSFFPDIDENYRNSYGERISRLREAAGVDETSAYGLALDDRYHFTRWERLDPYLTVGLGVTRYDDDFGSRTEPALRLGGGALYHLTDQLGIRGDVRVVTAGEDTEFNAQFTCGLMWSFAKAVPSAPPQPVMDDTGDRAADLDSDGDGLTDTEEERAGTSPFEADTDFDGLTDYDEITRYHTDPLKRDTDAGKVADGHEVIEDGTDPLDPEDDRLVFELNMQFAADGADIQPEYFSDLDAIAKVLRDSEATARIEGHIDAAADTVPLEVKALTQQRAAAVAAYFVNNWEVPQERLTAVGYGSERPRAANDPAQGNPVNRRMEIYVNMPALAPENK